jgi:hypothetical protein
MYVARVPRGAYLGHVVPPADDAALVGHAGPVLVRRLAFGGGGTGGGHAGGSWPRGHRR